MSISFFFFNYFVDALAYNLGFTTNVYKLDAFTGVHGFNPESRLPCPCRLTVFFKCPTIKTWQVEILPVLSGIVNKPSQLREKS